MLGTVIEIFSPSTQERQMQEDICESKASLIYTMYVPSQPGLQSKTRSQISKQIKIKAPPSPAIPSAHAPHSITTGLHRDCTASTSRESELGGRKDMKGNYKYRERRSQYKNVNFRII